MKKLPENETYTEHLGDAIRLALEPLRVFLDEIGGENSHISYVGEALHELALLKIEEIMEAVEPEVGKVMIVLAAEGNSVGVKCGDVVGAKVGYAARKKENVIFSEELALTDPPFKLDQKG